MHHTYYDDTVVSLSGVHSDIVYTILYAETRSDNTSFEMILKGAGYSWTRFAWPYKTPRLSLEGSGPGGIGSLRRKGGCRIRRENRRNGREIAKTKCTPLLFRRGRSTAKNKLSAHDRLCMANQKTRGCSLLVV